MSERISSVIDVITTTIPSGATGLSSVIDIAGHNVMAIEMPSTWVSANITLQACSTKDGTFQNVYDDSGSEVTIITAASRVVTINTNMLNIAPLRYIKLRSGTSSSPVNQTATRTIKLIVKG